MSVTDRILRLQRPFASRRSARRYRRHLDGLTDQKKAALLDDLKKSGATFRQYLSAPAPARGWRPAMPAPYQHYQHG